MISALLLVIANILFNIGYVLGLVDQNIIIIWVVACSIFILYLGGCDG